MKTLELALSEETARQLEETARQLGMTPEALVTLSLEEKLARLDQDFIKAARHVLSKNAELYKRLA